MKLRLNELKVALDDDLNQVKIQVAKRLRVKQQEISDWQVVRRSVDARKKAEPQLVYTVDVSLKPQVAARVRLDPPRIIRAEDTLPVIIQPGHQRLRGLPVIIGAGPAGIFAALKLAEYGYRPVVFEQGREVAGRRRDVEHFWATGELDAVSNVQFGEGGAGTFSDGKLTTRLNDPRIKEILQLMVEAGAPPEILYLHKPHVGTDCLRQVVANLRHLLLNRGGLIHFESPCNGLKFEQDRVTAVEINGAGEYLAGVVVLAVGNSARRMYHRLHEYEVALQSKALAIGLRIEHPQTLIDTAQYGEFAGHPQLGAADYQLTYQDRERQRAAYSFCMCPGGYVVAAASEPGGVVTNGMSEHARDSGAANSALVVTVRPEDFAGEGPLAGMELQQELERAAFQLGGGGYQAPAQRVEDFLHDRTSTGFEAWQPTYRPGVTPANLQEILPKEVGEVLAQALPDFNRKIRDFAWPDAVLTGVETRTSAPLRILRGENFVSVNFSGLYPVGEGAGYAGGIISAALDGLRVAEAIITEYAPPLAE